MEQIHSKTLSIKDLGNGRIGGYCLLFSTEDDPDLADDYFTKDSQLDIQDREYPVYYAHSLDPILNDRIIGNSSLKTDPVGVWIECQLSMRDEYEKAIYKLAKQGKLGWSTGSVSHLVRREQKSKAYFVKSWPIAEISLTPTPCEPRTNAQPIKTIEQLIADYDLNQNLTLDEEFNQCLHSVKSLTDRLRNLANLRLQQNKIPLAAKHEENINNLLLSLSSLKDCLPVSNEEILKLKDTLQDLQSWI